MEDSFEDEIVKVKEGGDLNINYIENEGRINKNEKETKSNKSEKKEEMNESIQKTQHEKRERKGQMKNGEIREKNGEIKEKNGEKNEKNSVKNEGFTENEVVWDKKGKGIENDWISKIDLILEGKMDYLRKKEIIWERESESDSNNVFIFIMFYFLPLLSFFGIFYKNLNQFINSFL